MVWFSATPVIGNNTSGFLRTNFGENEGIKQQRRFSGRMKQRTVSLFVLLVLSHSFKTCGTGKGFVGEGSLVVRLWAVLSIHILVGIGSVVYLC